MDLSDLFDQYKTNCLRGSSPNTTRLYHHTLRSFARFLGHCPTLADLTNENIENHMWAMVEAGCSPASANKNRSQLICLWSYANAEGMLPTRPTVKPLREPEIVPLGWLPTEIEALIRAAETDDSVIGDIPGKLWFPAFVRVLIDTGERVGAIRALTRNAIQDQYILVPAHVRKGKTRDRLYPIQPGTVEAIERLLSAHQYRHIWPWPYADNYLYNRYNAILKRAGLPTDRRSKFHRIRRTVASAVARAGGDPTAALDHASPKTTKKYLDPRIVGGVQVSDILAAYLADPTLRKRTREEQQHDRRKSG